MQHELRLLRSQVAAMEEQLRGLTAAWEAQLPEPRTLVAAQGAAQEKRASQRTDGAHAALEDALAQQQLAFAALQSLVLNAPLHSHGRELFAALHLSTTVGADAGDRVRQLHAHFDRAVAAIPAVVARFSRLELAGKPSLVPQSKVSVTGGADHTLVSSVFVSEIPSRSLRLVFDAARGYFNGLPSAVKRHLGTDMDRQVRTSSRPLDSLPPETLMLMPPSACCVTTCVATDRTCCTTTWRWAKPTTCSTGARRSRAPR